jgi:hypothetical protein
MMLTGLGSRSALIVVAVTLISTAIIVQLPVIALLLHLNPLHGPDWIFAAIGGVLAGSPARLIPMMHPVRS